MVTKTINIILVLLLLVQSTTAQIVIIAKKKLGGGVAAVQFDVVGAGTTIFTGTTIAANHTVTNGRNASAVLGILTWQNGGAAADVNSCTYNSNAMTEILDFRETVVSLQGVAIFIVPTGTGDGNPYSLSCDVDADLSANGGLTLTTASVYEVNQITPYRTPVTDNITATSTTSLTVANAADGDLVIDAISMYGETSAPSTTQTSIQPFADVGGNSWSGAVSYALATGSTNMGYSFSANERYAAFGAVALRP